MIINDYVGDDLMIMHAGHDGGVGKTSGFQTLISCSLQTWSAQCAMVPCLPHFCKLLSEPYSSNIYTCFAFVSTWTCIIGRMRQHCTICPQQWSHTMSGHVKSRHVQHIWLLHVFPKGNSCTTVLVHGFNPSRNIMRYYESVSQFGKSYPITLVWRCMERIETLKTWIHHNKNSWTFVLDRCPSPHGSELSDISWLDSRNFAGDNLITPICPMSWGKKAKNQTIDFYGELLDP